jgi:hypothetical protein
MARRCRSGRRLQRCRPLPPPDLSCFCRFARTACVVRAFLFLAIRISWLICCCAAQRQGGSLRAVGVSQNGQKGTVAGPHARTLKQPQHPDGGQSIVAGGKRTASPLLCRTHTGAIGFELDIYSHAVYCAGTTTSHWQRTWTRVTRNRQRCASTAKSSRMGIVNRLTL